MRIIYPLLVATVFLTACGGEEYQDLKDFVKNSGADMRGKVDPPPDVTPYEPMTYDNSAGLTDPFKPRKPEVRSTGGGLNQPDFTRPKQELEEFPLDGLKMVGFLHRGTSDYAVIRSSDGKVHQVTVGNYMGLNFGKITTISETEVKLKEMVQDGAGDWTERESSLQLAE